MITPLCIDHVVLRVRDVGRMVDFYTRILGGRLDKVQEAIGLYHVRLGASLVDLVPVDGKLGRAGGAAPGVDGRNMDHFCVQVAAFDPDALLAWLDGQGVSHGGFQPRYGAQGEGPSLYLTDPEGNGVEIKGPPA